MNGFGTAPSMPFPGINHEFKVPVHILQSINQLYAVLHVHIVIHVAMNDPDQSSVILKVI